MATAPQQPQAGRLVRIRGWPARHGDQDNKPHGREGNEHQAELSPDSQLDWGWGVTVDLNKKASSKAGDPAKYEVGVLVKCKPEESARRGGQNIHPPTPMVSASPVTLCLLVNSYLCAWKII